MNQEYHDRTKKLDSELPGTQQDQRGPIGSELNEYGHRGRVLAPVIGRYGGASSSGLSLILDLAARELARTRTRTNTNPNDTEANAAGRSGNAVRCANKARAECIMRGRGVGQNSRKNCKLQKARHLWVARTPQKQ